MVQMQSTALQDKKLIGSDDQERTSSKADQVHTDITVIEQSNSELGVDKNKSCNS